MIKLKLGPIAILVLFLGLISFCLRADDSSNSSGEFDHSVYELVLNQYLKHGRVDYKSLKENPQELDQYLKQVGDLAGYQFNRMHDNEKIAFYINVYNAATLKTVSDHYPVKSIKRIPGVWDKLKFPVAGQKLSLNEIEHKILRRQFAEPRVHFALVCASLGCPQLQDKPFTGANLSRDLDYQAARFLNDNTRNRLDKDKNVLYLSSIFKWFKKDFGDVMAFIAQYMSPDRRQFIDQNKPRIKYQYDWQLNDQD